MDSKSSTLACSSLTAFVSGSLSAFSYSKSNNSCRASRASSGKNLLMVLLASMLLALMISSEQVSAQQMTAAESAAAPENSQLETNSLSIDNEKRARFAFAKRRAFAFAKRDFGGSGRAFAFAKRSLADSASEAGAVLDIDSAEQQQMDKRYNSRFAFAKRGPMSRFAFAKRWPSASGAGRSFAFA